MEKQNNYYPILDLLKYIFAIFILFLHSTQYCDIYLLDNSVSSIVFRFFTDYLSRLAVPFFFVITSFLLFEKMKNKDYIEQKCILKKYIKHLFIIYVLWFFINCFWVFYNKFYILRESTDVSKIALYFLRDILLQNAFGGSWFILASLIDSIIIFFMCKNKVSNIFAWIISIFAYLVCLLMTWYNFLLPDSIKNVLDNINLVFGKMYLSFPFGLFLFMIGKTISKKLDYLVSIKLKIKIIFLILFSVLLLGEVFLIPLLSNYYRVSATSYIFSPLVVFIIAIIAISYPSQERNQLSIYLRNFSSIIYFSHAQILLILVLFCTKFLQITNVYYKFLIVFPATFIISNFLAYIIIKFSKKDKLKWLKLLY